MVLMRHRGAARKARTAEHFRLKLGVALIWPNLVNDGQPWTSPKSGVAAMQPGAMNDLLFSTRDR